MTQTQGKQLLILAARAEHLGDMREHNRISETEYIVRMNEIRQEAGLEPLHCKQPDPGE